MTGGGTGGHITPILAVAHELKKQLPDCHIVYIGERGGKYAHFADENPDIDEIHRIFAGKFRRYHGESWITRLLDVKTFVLNLRDLIFALIGVFQSLWLLRRIKPDSVFLKGGFVGVPVGLATAFWHYPFITHDSDALPGLANRITGRWAKFHATAMPAEYYSYKPETVKQVGVLVGPQYRLVDEKLIEQYRDQLNLPRTAKIVMVTGGSGGARIINQAIANSVKAHLDANPDIYVIHQVGIGKKDVYDEFSHPRLQVHELLKDMYVYSGCADVIVTRAGANTVAEFGIQKKACIVIPNPLLTGGHQLINGEYLKNENAAIVFDETRLKTEQGSELWDEVTNLLNNAKAANSIATNLNKLTIKNAAEKLAELLIKLSNK